MGLTIVRQIMLLNGFRFSVQNENGQFIAKILLR